MPTSDSGVPHKNGDGPRSGTRPVISGVPDFRSLSFEDAVRLFKEWGFVVKPGPLPEEVTLILDGPDFRTYSVADAVDLPGLAAAALRARWENGMLGGHQQKPGGSRRSTHRELIESPGEGLPQE